MSEEYSIEWFKEVKRDNPKWLDNQAFNLMEYYEAIETQRDALLIMERDNTKKISALEAELEATQYGLAMTEHYWINPMEYEEDRAKWSKREEALREKYMNAVKDNAE